MGSRRLAHWLALFEIYLKDGLAYRASAFIWVLSDAFGAIVMPIVLGSAATTGMIQGFDRQGFILYYLVSLTLTGLITCHFMWEFAFEIKEGIFSVYLLRPINYLEFMMVRNATWRVVRTIVLIPLLALLVLAYVPALQGAQLHLSPVFFLTVILGHLVSFMVVMALATIALFVTEATSIFEIYYIPMLFLSGQMFPVSLFPDWMRSLAYAMPFYYTTGLPTELLLGRVSQQAGWQGVGIQLAWIAFTYVAYRLSFRAGLKQYTGVGM